MTDELLIQREQLTVEDRTIANRLKGWQFPTDLILDYNNNGRLLVLDFDYGRGCNLKCKYCFTNGRCMPDNHVISNHCRNRPDISLSEVKRVLREAKALGLKAAKLIGAGEPFFQSDLLELLEYSTSLDIWVVVFTNGFILGSDRCKSIFGFDARDLVKYLAKLNVSLMVKSHSNHVSVEAEIVGLAGNQATEYITSRNRALTYLCEAGFNIPTPTRLGIECVLVNHDVNDIEEIYQNKFNQNIYVDIDPPMPIGMATKLTACGENATYRDRILICKLLYLINLRESLPFFGASPFYGSEPCTQLPNGLYVDVKGLVYPCPGFDGDAVLGDIRKEPIELIFSKNDYRNSWLANHHLCGSHNSPLGDVYHRCPPRELSSVLLQNWEEEISNYIRPFLRDCSNKEKQARIVNEIQRLRNIIYNRDQIYKES